MGTRVRSYSKINLGLAIGAVRPDGFHGLTTLYQTLDLHDFVTVTARRAEETKIILTTNHPFVPRDGRNTAWKMVEKCLVRLGVSAEVEIHIEKRLPVQGGLGAGSGNAVAALIGLERELGIALDGVSRLQMAAEVGSDVPLFLLGGAVLGLGRGEMVVPLPDLVGMHCVVAVPAVGVSTPAAYKAWDELAAAEPMSQNRDMGHPDLVDHPSVAGLTLAGKPDRLQELSLAYASLSAKTGDRKSGTSGIIRDSNPEIKRGLPDASQDYALNDLAENTLLALVRTGIGNGHASGLENDFEEVVFPQYPSLRITKRELMGNDTDGPALYAALSGSGSALFGLYRSEADAKAAQQRVQDSGVQAFLTETLPRSEYWARMFAE
jgi:4-diphosphocytidyl-2-C-methyl-D-erythritol kinase